MADPTELWTKINEETWPTQQSYEGGLIKKHGRPNRQTDRQMEDRKNKTE